MTQGAALARFRALASRFALPPEVEPELHIEVAKVGQASLYLSGVSAVWGDECVTGSAAGLGDFPVERAYMELVERISTVQAASRQRAWPLLDESGGRAGRVEAREVFPQAPSTSGLAWSRSNGIALGETYPAAASRALGELVERDRVLRSWFGGAAPSSLPLPGAPVLASLRELYDFEAVEFEAHAAESSQTHVAGLFAFPHGDAPFAYGFGAAATLAAALDKALTECVQGIGFLWGEEIPSSAPCASSTPGYHQEYYLVREHHAQLRRWLAGEHTLGGSLLPPRGSACPPRFVDLTPPWLGHGIRVVKAMPQGHTPLAFGRGHPWIVGDVPPQLSVHPIA